MNNIFLYLLILLAIFSDGSFSILNYAFAWRSLSSILFGDETTWIFIGTHANYKKFLTEEGKKLDEKIKRLNDRKNEHK